ncbi:MAG: hypothetical protein AAFV33_00355 [Chloroflexota bacterium]
MQDYIQGILEENTPTESYHGVAFSRKLVLRTIHGKQVTIDDPEGLAQDIKTGKTYQLVIVVSGAEKVRAFTQSITRTGKLSGTIRSLKWEPDIEQFQVCDDDLVSQPMSVIGTVNGHVLLPRMLLGGVAVGNAVTWGIDQFQLVAVYK